MNPVARSVLVACALIALTADRVVLFAADPPSRIYRGLFGPDPDVALTSHPVVEVRVSTYEARGETVARPGEGIDETQLHDGQFYTGIASGLTYRRKTRTATLNGGVGNALRVYQATGLTTAEHSAFGTMELRANRRTIVRSAASVLYTPYHQILGLPIGTEPSPGTDAAATTDASTTLSAGTSVAHQVGRRGMLTAGYDGRFTTYSSNLPGPLSQQAGVTYTHEFAKGLALRVGDGIRVLEAGGSEPVVAQDIALGLDVNRSLTTSKRTTVTFTTGSSIASNDRGRQLIFAGSGTLTHRIGRSWQTAVTFDRGLQVTDLLPEPFIGNSTGFNVGGFLGRRTSMRLRGTYAFGDIEVNGSASRYVSYLGEARVAVALGRHFQVYAEHLYYQHRFPRGVPLPPGVRFRDVQHGTRFGLDVWALLTGQS